MVRVGGANWFFIDRYYFNTFCSNVGLWIVLLEDKKIKFDGSGKAESNDAVSTLTLYEVLSDIEINKYT